MAGGAEARAEKKETIEKLYELFGGHKQIILTSFTNVGSSQIQQIRKALRPFNSVLVISKNVLISSFRPLSRKSSE
jgi:ribosomal protein L10